MHARNADEGGRAIAMHDIRSLWPVLLGVIMMATAIAYFIA
jgi:hypothetical protein